MDEPTAKEWEIVTEREGVVADAQHAKIQPSMRVNPVRTSYIQPGADSVTEVADAGEDHGHAVFIGGRDDFAVAH